MRVNHHVFYTLALYWDGCFIKGGISHRGTDEDLFSVLLHSSTGKLLLAFWRNVMPPTWGSSCRTRVILKMKLLQFLKWRCLCKHYVSLLPRILIFHTFLGSQSGCFNPERLPSIRVSLGSDGEKNFFCQEYTPVTVLSQGSQWVTFAGGRSCIFALVRTVCTACSLTHNDTRGWG